MSLVSFSLWTYCLKAQQDQQWYGGQASLNPLPQRHSAIVIIVNLLHHFLENLQWRKEQYLKERKLVVEYKGVQSSSCCSGLLAS